jgi:hypothetical protein
MIIRFLTSLLLISTSFGVSAQTHASDATGTTEIAIEDHADALRQVLSRGRLIYTYDQAAWHSTDMLRSVLPTERWPRAGGWVVEGEGQELAITYFGMEGNEPYIFAILRADGDSGYSATLPPDDNRQALPMPATTRQLIDARNAAFAALSANPPGRCVDAAMNTVVLPPDDEGNVSVYFLTPQTVTGIYPAGGHYRFTMSPDGTLLSSRAFMNSCFPIDTSAQTESDNGPEAFALTHLLDPQPTEIHVFLSLWMQIPLYVITNDNGAVWAVEGNRVRLLDQVSDANGN